VPPEEKASLFSPVACLETGLLLGPRPSFCKVTVPLMLESVLPRFI
jgi:hypothetical protein